ncbi:MAG: class I SAM-dependent RNA methyltransferase, partial [Flavobacteriaceae bacterium]|nr:class I SAM-dependent RNA methyltransferase [Flavobacteriaceae bacterium]
MTRKKRNIVFENIEVTDVGAKGKAIAKAPDGKVIFLTNTVPGDIATIQITKKKRSYYEGRVVELIKLSDKRTQPVCGHFQDCGGCKWQHLQYNYQLFYKEKEVVDNLKRIGHLSLPEISPILGSEKKYFYRNKMEFSFSDNRWMTADEIASGKAIDSKHALGFHIAGMWDKILDIETCHLQEDPSNAIRNGIKAFAVENELEFFNTRE